MLGNEYGKLLPFLVQLVASLQFYKTCFTSGSGRYDQSQTEITVADERQ